MVDDERDAECVEEVAVFHDVLRVQVQHQVPPESRDAHRHPAHGAELRCASQVAHEVEAHRTHALPVQGRRSSVV